MSLTALFDRSTASSNRFKIINANLKRRDNIRDFIEGLKDSECWPYPEHQNGASVAATFFEDDDKPVLLEVEVRQGRLEDLTVLYLTNVKRPIQGAPSAQTALVDLAIELVPADGPGAYVLDIEHVEDEDGRKASPKLSMAEANELRSTFMHRYEWVASKLRSVNLARADAIDDLLRQSEGGDESSDDDQLDRFGGNEEPLSGEEDFVELESDGHSEDVDGEKTSYEYAIDQEYLDVHATIGDQNLRSIEQSSLSGGNLPTPSATALGCAAHPRTILDPYATYEEDAISTPSKKRTLSLLEPEQKRRRCKELLEQANAALAEVKQLFDELPNSSDQNARSHGESRLSDQSWGSM